MIMLIGTYSGVSDKKIISHNLHLLPNLLGHLSIVGPIILVKGIFDRYNGIVSNKGLVHLLQTVTQYFLRPVVVLQEKNILTQGSQSVIIKFQNTK